MAHGNRRYLFLSVLPTSMTSPWTTWWGGRKNGRGDCLNIMAQAAIIFGLCLLSEGLDALIPVAFPASVIALLLLGLLLFTGVLKPQHIQKFSAFLIANMAFFFLPSCVEVVEHAPAILRQLLPFALVVVLTTPVVYFVTAWTVQLLIRRGKGAGRRG